VSNERGKCKQKKDLRKLDRNTPEYWNEMLRREGLTMDRGLQPNLVSYVGSASDLEDVDANIQSDAIECGGGRRVRPKAQLE